MPVVHQQSLKILGGLYPQKIFISKGTDILCLILQNILVLDIDIPKQICMLFKSLKVLIQIYQGYYFGFHGNIDQITLSG